MSRTQNTARTLRRADVTVTFREGHNPRPRCLSALFSASGSICCLAAGSFPYPVARIGGDLDGASLQEQLRHDTP